MNIDAGHSPRCGGCGNPLDPTETHVCEDCRRSYGLGEPEGGEDGQGH
ncbi:protein NinF [Erwinia sp. V71]